MPIVIREFHAARSPAALNEEWFIVENTGEKAFSTAGCTISVTRGSGRPRALGTMDPGFTLLPGQRRRIVTGNPGKKAHGKSPEAEGTLENYHLFLGAPLLAAPGTVVVLTMRQHELARAAYDPKLPSGVVATPEEA